MSDHGDSAAIRNYADRFRSAGRRLQAISDDADAWVYFCTADWKGQFKDDLLRLWNENFTANDALNARAWADEREAFIKAHPNRARLYDANVDPGKTAFRTLIDACNSFAAWLDDYATAIDKADQADQTKFWVDVGIGVVVLVATVATAGLAAPETLAGGIALGAIIGGGTSVIMDASNQTIDNMILKGDSFGQALGDLNVQELVAAFGVGAIVGGFTVILGTGLSSVLTSGVSRIFGQAAINTFSKIGIAGLSFGTASALTDVATQEVLTGKVDWTQVALAGGMGVIGGAAGTAVMEVTGPEGTFTASVRPDGLLTVRNADNDFVGTGTISEDGTRIVVQPPKGDPFTISLSGKVQVSDGVSGFKVEDGQLTQIWSTGDGKTQLTVLTGRDSVPGELIDPTTGKLVVREGWTVSQTLPEGTVTLSNGSAQVRGLVVAEQLGSGAPTGPQAVTLLPDGEIAPTGPSIASDSGVQGVRLGSWVTFGADAGSGGADPVADLLARFPGSGGSDGPSPPGIDPTPTTGPGDGGLGPRSGLDLPGAKGWEPPGWNGQPGPGSSVVIGGKTYTDFPSTPAARSGMGPEAGEGLATTLPGGPTGTRLSAPEPSGPAARTATTSGVDVALTDPPETAASVAGTENTGQPPIDLVAGAGSPSASGAAGAGGWPRTSALVAGSTSGWASSWGMSAPAGLGPAVAPTPSPPRVSEVPAPLTALPQPPPELTLSPPPEVPPPVGPRPTPPVTSVPGPASIEVPPPGVPAPSAPLAPARPPLPRPGPTPDPTQVPTPLPRPGAPAPSTPAGPPWLPSGPTPGPAQEPPASPPGALPSGQRPRVDPDVPTLPRPPGPGVELPRPGATGGRQPVREVPPPVAGEVPPLPRQEVLPPATTEVPSPAGQEVTPPQSWLPRPPVEVPPPSAGSSRPAGVLRPPAASAGPSVEGPEGDAGGNAEGEPDRGRATGSDLGFVSDREEVPQPRSTSNRGAEKPEPEPAAAAAPAPPQGISAWPPGPAEAELAGREVTRVEPLPDWPEWREVFLVTFADGSRAVWKVRPERQMVHNLAFFRTSEVLGFDLVPVTTLRSLPGRGEGSLQEWVEGSPIQWPITGYPELDQQMGAVLDYIGAEADRHNLNAIVRPDGRLAFTDNKASFSKQSGLATSSDFVKAWRNRPLHPEVVEKVRSVSPEDYRAMLLGTGLAEAEADHAVARLQEIQVHGRITGEADAGGVLPMAGGPAAALGDGGLAGGSDHIHPLKPPPGRTRPLGPKVTRPLTEERWREHGPNLLPPGDPDLLRQPPHLPYTERPRPVSVPGVDPADVLDEGSPGFWRLVDEIRRLSRETNLEIAVVEREGGTFAIVAGGKYGLEDDPALEIRRWWMHTHPYWTRADGPSLGDLRTLARSHGQRYAYLVEPGREAYRYEVPDWMREAFRWPPAPSPETDRSLRDVLRSLRQWDRWTRPGEDGRTAIEQLGASLEDAGRRLQQAVEALRRAVTERPEQVEALGQQAEDLAVGLADLVERADGAVATLRGARSTLESGLRERGALTSPAGPEPGLRLRLNEILASGAVEDLAQAVDRADAVLTTVAAELQRLGFALPTRTPPEAMAERGGPVEATPPRGPGRVPAPRPAEVDAGGAPPVAEGSELAPSGPTSQTGAMAASEDGDLAEPLAGDGAPAPGQGAPGSQDLAGWWRHLRARISGRGHGSGTEEALRRRQREEREQFIREAWSELKEVPAGRRGEVLERLSGEWRRLLETQGREWEERFYGHADGRQELAAALRRMENEGAPSAGNVDRRELVEGAFGAHRAFDVYRYPAGVEHPAMTVVTVWIRLQPDPDVTPEEVALTQELARWSVDHYLNAPRNRLPDGSVLHVEVRFVEAEIPGAVHVNLHSDRRPVTAGDWSVDIPWWSDRTFGAPLYPYAHEVGHYLGLNDEYADPRVPQRRVFRDRSLMGPPPWEGLKDRHLGTIAQTAATARPLPEPDLAEGLVATRYDPRSNRRQTLLTADTRLQELLAGPIPDTPLAIEDLRAPLERYLGHVRAWIERNRPAADDELAARARAHAAQAERVLAHLDVKLAVSQWAWWTGPGPDGERAVDQIAAKLNDAVARYRQGARAAQEAIAAGGLVEDPMPFLLRDLDAAIREADGVVQILRGIRSGAMAAVERLEALVSLADLDPELKVRVDELLTSPRADELDRLVGEADDLLTTAAARLRPPDTSSSSTPPVPGPGGGDPGPTGSAGVPGAPSRLRSWPSAPPAAGGDEEVAAEGDPSPPQPSWPAAPAGALRVTPLALDGADGEPPARGSVRTVPLAPTSSGEGVARAADRPGGDDAVAPEPGSTSATPRAEPELRARQHAERAQLLARQEAELRAAPSKRRPALRSEHSRQWRELRERQDREWERWWAGQAGRPLDRSEEFRAQLRRMESAGAPEAGHVFEAGVVPEVDPSGHEVGRIAYHFTHRFDVILHPEGLALPATTEITLYVQLRPDRGVTPEDLERVEQYASQAVEHFLTAPRHRLPDGSVLKVGVRFTTEESDLYLPVRLHAGRGRMSVREWYVEARLSAFAHEVAHGIGLGDEYYDPERLTPGRETEDAPGVFRDASLMAVDTLWTELKPRHLERIWGLIETARRAVPAESLEQGLTRYRFDPLSNRRQALLTADSQLERLLAEPRPADAEGIVGLIADLERAAAQVQGWLDRNQPEPSDELATRAHQHLDRARRLLLDLERARRRSGLPSPDDAGADRSTIPPNLGSGVPAEAIEFIARHTAAFLAGGGRVEVLEPGSSREPWSGQAENLALAAEGSDRVAAGRRLLAHALRQPYVVVAHREGVVLAAIGFDLDPSGALDVRFAGSAEAGTGAGTAAHFELALYAARRGLRVEDGYTRDARGYHLALGRRLDSEFPGDSVWSASDVEQIAREVTARVGPPEASHLDPPPSPPVTRLIEGMAEARRAVDDLHRAVTWGLEPGEVEGRRAAAEAALQALEEVLRTARGSRPSCGPTWRGSSAPAGS